jgi:hypothetical protein
MAITVKRKTAKFRVGIKEAKNRVGCMVVGVFKLRRGFCKRIGGCILLFVYFYVLAV